MAGRDRREDAGQYYPGGGVVPKTPTGQGGGGTSDYDQLANKPRINNHELTGNKTAEQLGLAAQSDIPDVTGKLPLRPLPKYLHFLAFDDTYPADAAWLYAQLGPSDMGRCSAVRRGGKLYRNYDWTFDNAAEFVVRMSGNATRFASVGVASVGSRLTENDVMSAVNSRYYKCLPGMTLDGINEKGVVCEINVDGGPKDGWHGDADEGGIHILAAVRWVLDHGETAEEAAEWLADRVIQPQGEMNFHFMVADATSTYIVENGEAHDVTDGTKVLTNYALYDEANEGGGKERYTLLAGGADISAVNFTNAYQSGNTWDSDFESAEQHAEAIEQWAAQGTDKEAHRGKTTESGKAWWQSVHTTEYDFAAKTMKVAVQEVDDWYTFAVDAAAQSIETDDTVTRTSANPVKSSGIWSAVWGALTAIPTGFTSLYDWCAAKLGEKRDLTDAAVWEKAPFDYYTDSTGRIFMRTSATSNSYDGGNGFVLDYGYPSPYEDGQIWRYTEDGFMNYDMTEDGKNNPSAPSISFTLGPTFTRHPSGTLVQVSRSFVHAPDATTTGIAAFDGKGKLKAAAAGDIPHDDTKLNAVHTTSIGENKVYWDENYFCIFPIWGTRFLTQIYLRNFDDLQILTSGQTLSGYLQSLLIDPANASATGSPADAKLTRDFVNTMVSTNSAHYLTARAGTAGSYTYPPFASAAALRAAVSAHTEQTPQFFYAGEAFTPTKNDWVIVSEDEDHPLGTITPASRYGFVGTFGSGGSFQYQVSYKLPLTTAQIAALDSEITKALVTWLTTFKGTDTATTLASIIAMLAHLESDGTADDTFAADLFGKQVAKEAIDDRTKASASAITGDALTLPDGGVVSASSSAPTITFGTARQDGLRFCELYLTNPDAAADGAIVSISGKVCSDISLTDLPKLDKGATYYFTFAEFKVENNISHWKVSKQKLDAMGGDIPTAA